MDCLNTSSYTLQSNIAGMTLVAASANHNNSTSPSKRLRPQEQDLEHNKEKPAQIKRPSYQKSYTMTAVHARQGSWAILGLL